MKHLLSLTDLTAEEILELLDLADELKADHKRGHPQAAARREDPGA